MQVYNARMLSNSAIAHRRIMPGAPRQHQLVRFFVAVLCPLAAVTHCCRANGAPLKSGVTTRVWPPIPQGEISGLVQEAMTHARAGKQDLAKSVAARSDEAIPLLEPYSHDENGNVREAVMTIAGSSHSPQALRLLCNVISIKPKKNEITNLSSRPLFLITRTYSRREIVHWGGAALEMQLMRYGSYFPEATLTLASFNTPTSRLHLKKLRWQARPGDQVLMGEDSPPATASFVADLALAEAGDGSALVRLCRQLRSKRVNDRVWLCHALPYIENKGILRVMKVFLSDERTAKENTFIGCLGSEKATIKTYPSSRVCDVAATAIIFKNLGNRAGHLYSGNRLSAHEINEARRRLASWL